MRPAPFLTLLLALACAAPFAFAGDAAAPAAGAAPREVLLDAPADVPPALLGTKVAAEVTVRAFVAPSGLVDSARAVSGDPRLHASAEAAVRWWVFAPAAAPGQVTVRVPVAAEEDADGLHPDVIALALRSEAEGDLRTALAAWVGVLARLGTSPVALNEWAIREHALGLARRITPPPPPGDAIGGTARGARVQQQRTVARAEHLALVGKFDNALLRSPWWDEVYLWRAGSLAGCGRTAEALRSLRAYRLATADTAGAAFAGRLVDRLAAADTVGVCEAIKTWRVVSEPRRR